MIPSHILEAQRLGDVDTARHYYTAQLKNTPQDALWHTLLGISYAQHHAYDTAYTHLLQAVTYNKNANNLSQLATVCTHLARFDEAIEYFDTSLALHPYAPIVHNNYGLLWMKKQDIMRAITHFTMAISQEPSYYEAYYNMGLCYMHNTEYNKAQHRFQQTLDLHPNHHTSHYQLALTYELQGQWDSAITHYTACLAITKHTYAYHGLGRCLMKIGDAETALEHFKSALTYGDTSEEIWHNLAMCYHQLSAPAMALEAWLKLLHTTTSHEALYHIGVCYQQMYRYQEACDYFQEALILDATHIDTYLNLIAIAIERYNPTQALSFIEQAQHHHPTREDLVYLKASLTQNGTVEKAPITYVSQLFDHYAPHYDTHVVNILRYQLPDLIAHTLSEYIQPDKKWHRAYDLGCGTGLIGRVIRPYVEHLCGIDVSTDMLKIADAQDIYTNTIQSDVTTIIPTLDSADLIVMADLLPYCGTLEWLQTLHTILTPGALVILSIEKDNTIDTYQLHEHARFKHNSHYVIANLTSLVCVESRDITLRTQAGHAVYGALLVCRKV